MQMADTLDELELTEDQTLKDIDLDELVSQKRLQKQKIYTSIPPADYIWLQNTANRMACTKSEAIRRLVHNARIRDHFDEEKLI